MTPFSSIETISGQVKVIPGNDIDTDRIIPARFMKGVTFGELTGNAFYDVRHNPDGSPNDSPLNKPPFDTASILVVENNFGCGSSREHAPQALARSFGKIRAILGESFAEIFQGNAHALGMPCIVVSAKTRETIEEILTQSPWEELEIRLNEATTTGGIVQIPLMLSGRTFYGELSEGALHSFLTGTYDHLAELLEWTDAVEEQMKALGYL